MKDFLQFFKTLDKSIKLKFLIFIFFILVNSMLEVISISFFLPIIELVGQNKVSDINKYNIFFLEKLNLDINSLVSLSLIALTAIILKNIAFVLINLWQISFINKVELTISKKIFSNYMNRNYNFFLKKNSSEIIRNLTIEISHIVKGLGSFFAISVEIFLLIFLAIYLLLINFKITILLLLIISALGLVVHFLFQRKIKFWSEGRVKLSAEYLKILIQTFNSIKEIFVFKRKDEMKDYHDNKKLELIKLNKKFSIVNMLPKPLLETAVFLILIFFIIQFNQSESFFSYLTIYALVLIRIYPAITRILINLQSFRYRLPAFKVIKKDFSIIDEKRNINLIHLEKDFFKSKINIENLSFRYKDKKIINDLNVELNVGKIYGVVGPSGSGKSTFLDLIMGLKNPNSGKIKFDDKEINAENYNWLSVIGYVPQSPYLYDETILENIGFGLKKDQINIEQVNYAVERSNLKSFIKTLPEGLDNLIGEKGVRISGGQMQRISLARAMYNDPKFLILDEVTNQLDDEIESQIIKDLQILKKDRLILFVTHKKKLLDSFDEIIDLEKR